LEANGNEHLPALEVGVGESNLIKKKFLLLYLSSIPRRDGTTKRRRNVLCSGILPEKRLNVVRH
jgi:hypothetical protein